MTGEVFDEYVKVDGMDHELVPCPVCGAKAELWRYRETPDAPSSTAGMCSNGEKFGPQDGLTNEGCMLYLPPHCFYRPRIKDAVAYWNSYAKALCDLREKHGKGNQEGVGQSPSVHRSQVALLHGG